MLSAIGFYVQSMEMLTAIPLFTPIRRENYQYNARNTPPTPISTQMDRKIELTHKPILFLEACRSSTLSFRRAGRL